MSVYVDAGYVAALGALATYGSTLLMRERAARRRLSVVEVPGDGDGTTTNKADRADVPTR